MELRVESMNGSCSVAIEGGMTIYESIEQKEALVKALQDVDVGGYMELNLSEVDEMDTAGVQIMLMLKKAAHRANKGVLLVELSPAVLDVIDRYNLNECLEDSVATS